MAKIRVLLADDHAVLRAGLRLLINGQSDMEVVGEAANAHEACQRTAELAPDVLTLDLSMPGGGGMAILGRLRQEFPTMRILVLTMHDDPAYLRTVLAAGGSGYVVKTAADTELLTAIRAISKGRTFVDLRLNESAVSAVLGGRESSASKAPAPTPLSAREHEVLVFLAQGHTNQVIADRLFLSVKTIETYRARIVEKLGLKTRADFFRYATETGLLGREQDAGESTMP